MAAAHACLIELEPGTPARAIVEEARRLVDAGLRVTIIGGPRAAAALSPLPGACRLIVIPKPVGRLSKLRAGWALWRQAARSGADYYHAHSTIGLMAATAAIAFLCRGARYYGDFNNIIIAARGRNEHPAATDTFEHEAHWDREPTEAERQRIDATLAIIPDDAHTALDLGCGDGRITNRLAERMGEVVGIDQASTALKFLAPNVRAMQAAADALPLPDRSVDLVLATEVLEHLPDHVLKQAVAEIQRVARRYIVIGVPHREQLRVKDIVCPVDGRRFNVNGHLHTFDRSRLERLFRHFRLTKLEECGAVGQFTYRPALRWIKQRIGGTWARPAICMCPECGSDLSPTDQPERNAVARWCDERNRKWRAKHPRGRSHVIALYERVR